MLDGTPIGARQQPLIVERVDLPIQSAGRPALARGFLHIPESRVLVFYPQEGAVVGPAQFRTQCVANWEGQVEDAHMSQIRNIEPSAKLAAERLRKDWKQTTSILRAGGAALFEFNDMTANLPASLHLNSVYGPKRLLPGTLDQLSKAVKQVLCTCVTSARFEYVFSHPVLRSVAYRIADLSAREYRPRQAGPKSATNCRDSVATICLP